MEALDMREDYYIIIERHLPSGSYRVKDNTIFDDREKAEHIAAHWKEIYSYIDFYVCRIGLPFRSEENG